MTIQNLCEVNRSSVDVDFTENVKNTKDNKTNVELWNGRGRTNKVVGQNRIRK